MLPQANVFARSPVTSSLCAPCPTELLVGDSPMVVTIVISRFGTQDNTGMFETTLHLGYICDPTFDCSQVVRNVMFNGLHKTLLFLVIRVENHRLVLPLIRRVCLFISPSLFVLHSIFDFLNLCMRLLTSTPSL